MVEFVKVIVDIVDLGIFLLEFLYFQHFWRLADQVEWVNVLVKGKLWNERLCICTWCNQHNFHCIIDLFQSCLFSCIVILFVKALKTLEWNVFVVLWEIFEYFHNFFIVKVIDLWINPNNLSLLDSSQVKHILIWHLNYLDSNLTSFFFFCFWQDEEAELWHQDNTFFLREVCHIGCLVFANINTSRDSITGNLLLTHVDLEVDSLVIILFYTCLFFRCLWESWPIVHTIIL